MEINRNVMSFGRGCLFSLSAKCFALVFNLTKIPKQTKKNDSITHLVV